MKRLFLAPLLFAVVILVVAIPLANVAHAQPTIPLDETTYEQAYVPCGNKDVTKKVKNSNGTISEVDAEQTITLSDGRTKTIRGDGIVDNPCQFTHIIVFANKLITNLIIVGVIIATMGFAYAGLLYITAMGSSEKVSHAHSIFIKTFWGFVFMLSAWLIAYTMEQIFLTDEAKSRSFLQERTP
ncbi:MAG: hypothetical protein A2W52_03075 [Candidatus Taylorbacteria bacterium RIFCSPHIGHO2_02_49_25]|uniref:Uncharacterized protein n=1 Tax=Candidatus Taylorbacteria bacterium RIFCSPHIGHO2_02_49_25 TaxID=1802305 RepID=A0A1G2MAX7_9BACT|nr:MAG: hypothetical protein UY62_C0094G0004 [Parcubacteria group bacterium GW2011_GWF2_50_9]OHA21060.1 MAG: hypothetical protein A2W52_03075 [Candidatus Taylorbacteria bacterium RIFCSPHIGHO2_02_49_25]OHA37363.1 MAG: hypothetical protein A2W65_00485 [Candidatus Taylorbacteria bacterium RIFCSPLOWO2_02_50_13]OHA45733.1 MAG: hypothetical protein A3G61_03195 [Candidatus Taylorbacteria bacterium RIFCSPLOWO2_12_FULL_49_67]HCB35645.1 hypothetical protein [Candidatus Taylorbacteria bacterium]